MNVHGFYALGVSIGRTAEGFMDRSVLEKVGYIFSWLILFSYIGEGERTK